jgi:limonene-1,2-epoxide hydrolase
VDWDTWARRFEHIGGTEEFVAFFAPEGVFRDPVTPWTTDVRKVADDTNALFPDWHQRVDVIRGGDDWAVFEWTGTGTFQGTIPISMEGATVIAVDGDGLVLSWRDYLDTNEPTQQIQAGLQQG